VVTALIGGRRRAGLLTFVSDGFAVAVNALSKSARLGSAKVNRVRDLGCPFSVVCAERFRT
jgi:hypothetical protein